MKLLVLFLLLFLQSHLVFVQDDFGDDDDDESNDDSGDGPQSTIDTHIMFGNNARQGEFPFVVSIQEVKNKRFAHMCTGSILNDNTILTVCDIIFILNLKFFRIFLLFFKAGHCVKGKWKKNLYVYIGHVNISKLRNRKYLFKVKRMILNKKFDRDEYHGEGVTLNDIGLIKTKKKIKFKTFKEISAKKSCLPSANEEPDTSKCIAIGWGLKEQMKKTQRLQKVNMKLTKKCNYLKDKKGDLCAIGEKGRKKGGVW